MNSARLAHLLLPAFLIGGGAALGCSSTDPGAGDENGIGAGTGGLVEGTGGAATAAGGASGDPSAAGGSPAISEPRSDRVVGYLPTYRSLSPAGVDLSALTHLCIAFANPSASSLADFDADATTITTLVDAAHEQGVQVLASIAGAAGGEAVAAEITAPKVDAYVAALLALIDRYNLDGIDVDIEGDNVNADYEPFVQKLSAALPEGQLLTAAVATWNGDDFSDAALAEYDFINLMAYDSCGTWSDACEHSTLASAQSQLDYWVGQRGIAQERMVLGVPFYGYCWGSACPATALTWSEILAAHPDVARTQDLVQEPNYYLSYNSPATIAAKMRLADEHGGVMIWELGQDAPGADSLLATIADD